MNDALLSLALVMLVPPVLLAAACLAYSTLCAFMMWRLRRRESRPLLAWRR